MILYRCNKLDDTFEGSAHSRGNCTDSDTIFSPYGATGLNVFFFKQILLGWKRDMAWAYGVNHHVEARRRPAFRKTLN